MSQNEGTITKMTFVEKEAPTPAEARIQFLTHKLGYAIDELVKEKGGSELENDETMQISKQDLNSIYFTIKQELENRKEYYFGE